MSSMEDKKEERGRVIKEIVKGLNKTFNEYEIFVNRYNKDKKFEDFVHANSSLEIIRMIVNSDMIENIIHGSDAWDNIYDEDLEKIHKNDFDKIIKIVSKETVIDKIRDSMKNCNV